MTHNANGVRRSCTLGARTRIGTLLLGGGLAMLLPVRPGNARQSPGPSPGALCVAAVHAAELRYHLPPRLLLSISLVEAGRQMQRLEPWPWTVQAEDRGHYFDSKRQAVEWVKDAMARGVTSIDTGCMQVNLFYHPRAFETLDAAFDPYRNADYAARFLLQLYVATGDWRQAVGAYHSQTLALAAPYAARVDHVLSAGGSGWLGQPKRPTLLSELAQAWRATLGNGRVDTGGRDKE